MVFTHNEIGKLIINILGIGNINLAQGKMPESCFGRNEKNELFKKIVTKP